VTEDGIEKDLAISYVSRFVITQRLIERGLKANIFIMAFAGAEQKGDLDDFNAEGKYDGMKQHVDTVIANDAFVIGLAKRHPNLAVSGLNPGLISTEIRSNVYGGNAFFEKAMEGFISLISGISPEKYAEQVLPVFLTEHKSGQELMCNQYGNLIEKSSFLSNPDNVEKVWTETRKLLSSQPRAI
jgi:hypothetical protein